MYPTLIGLRAIFSKRLRFKYRYTPIYLRQKMFSQRCRNVLCGRGEEGKWRGFKAAS